MRLHFIRSLPALLLLSGMLCSAGLHAQSMTRSVVGSTGGYYDNLQFGDLHFTLGEVAVGRYIDNGMELDEGFHRMYYQVFVSAEEVHADQWDVKIYPNPVADRLYLEIPDERPVHALLFNVYGQLVLSEEGIIQHGSLNIDQLPAGTYWLRLRDEQGEQGVYQIQKVSF